MNWSPYSTAEEPQPNSHAHQDSSTEVAAPAADRPVLRVVKGPDGLESRLPRPVEVTVTPAAGEDTAHRTPHSSVSEPENVSAGRAGCAEAETPHTAPETEPESAVSPRGVPREEIRAWVRGLLVPPHVVRSAPASVAEVVAYGESGGYTHATEGPVRTVGRLWAYLIAAPVTVVCLLVTWILQRPGRAATVAIAGVLVWLAIATA